MIRRTLTALLALALAGCGGENASSNLGSARSALPPAEAVPVSPVISSRSAKRLFGTEPTASAHRPEPIGFYSKGCAAGNVQLPETGATWQAMRLSRNRNWGHPETIDLLQRVSRVAAQQPGGAGIYVGDISQPKGGPMLTGHASHQIGLDADIWLMQAPRLNLTEAERENISAVSFRRSGGAFTNDRWSRAQHEVVKAAAQDPRTARIFIFPGAKVQMCNDETGDRSWLRKVRPYYGHHYHFHVRLNCPPGAACRNQDPPPPGDGCAEAQEWVNNILNPPPPDPDYVAPPPKKELTLADLPAQCSGVLAAN